ncbi:MAG TPA: hypothetical protein VK694_04970 [Verrucomicrobiae bacterium]|nr:hypothetical protein [Verrucomicrobiae bacterium]
MSHDIAATASEHHYILGIDLYLGSNPHDTRDFPGLRSPDALGQLDSSLKLLPKIDDGQGVPRTQLTPSAFRAVARWAERHCAPDALQNLTIWLGDHVNQGFAFGYASEIPLQ